MSTSVTLCVLRHPCDGQGRITSGLYSTDVTFHSGHTAGQAQTTKKWGVHSFYDAQKHRTIWAERKRMNSQPWEEGSENLKLSNDLRYYQLWCLWGTGSWFQAPHRTGDRARGPFKAKGLNWGPSLKLRTWNNWSLVKNGSQTSTHLPKEEIRKCGAPDADWDFSCLRIPAEAPNLRTNKYPSDNRGTNR